MGEFTIADELDGKGWPGSRPGLVGPKPVANKDSTSPGVAGLDTVTTEKSVECVTAGPAGVVAISGRNIGMTWSTHLIFPPPLILRLDGSSVMDAWRAAVFPGTAASPPCPLAPRNAPVPPTIARLLRF